MKVIFLNLTIAFLFYSCTNHKQAAQFLSKPDTSINKNNACNTLFLDSVTLNSFIAKENIGEDIALRMHSFYNNRNFEFAWFGEDGLTEQVRGFWSLFSYYNTSLKDTSLYNKTLKKEMADLIIKDSLVFQPGDTNIVKTELLLTEYFLRYLIKRYGEDAVRFKEMENFIPAKKYEVMQVARTVLTSKKAGQGYEDSNKSFILLKEQLQKYYDLSKKGNWQTIPAINKTYRKGSSAPVIILVRKRLQVTGELTGTDSSASFDNLLENAVKNFQVNFGYTPNGIITNSLISDMNVPAIKRVQQILINMNRMRWLPDEAYAKLIITNIPEFKLYVYEGDKEMFNMNTIVGKDGHNTVIFTGNLNEIVFSPYWNIPGNIVQKEILPKIKENRNYLEEQNMEITGEDNGIPSVRQLPGPRNSLGRVKFLFPNDFDIYFHDTPAKSLFSKDNRAYSHGCIRLSDPVKLAEYLLQDKIEWTPAKIKEAMNSKTEKHVMLKNAVPVIISYYTAWVDKTGKINFRNDIYGHDSIVASKMFTDPR